MIATLSSYGRFFGPCHIQTLSVAACVAEELWKSGDGRSTRGVLERVVRDLARSAGRAHPDRISALNRLRDLLVQENEMREAILVQTEIAECWLLLGETVAARLELESLLMSSQAPASENQAVFNALR